MFSCSSFHSTLICSKVKMMILSCPFWKDMRRGSSCLVRIRQASTSSGKYQWDDAFQLERRLTDEEKAVRDTARQYAQEKLLPRVVSANREER